jgi:hypothetical protein
MILVMSSKKVAATVPNQDNQMDVAQPSANVNAMPGVNVSHPPAYQLSRLQLTEAELRSRYMDATCYENRGIVLQFVNNNCPGASTMIGGVRLAMGDVRKIPAYLSKYEGQVKERALFYLKKHFLENQCSLGATENLCPDDFGMSYSVASLSPTGMKLNPSGRHEGPLFWCLWEDLVQPIKLQTLMNGVH